MSGDREQSISYGGREVERGEGHVTSDQEALWPWRAEQKGPSMKEALLCGEQSGPWPFTSHLSTREPWPQGHMDQDPQKRGRRD